MTATGNSSSRLIAAIGLLADLALPLSFLYAWWWPSQYARDDTGLLAAVLIGEWALAAVMVGIAIFAKLARSGGFQGVVGGLYFLMPAVAMGYFLVGIFSGLTAGGEFTPLLIVIAGQLWRYFSILLRGGSSSAFPQNGKQALLVLFLLPAVAILIWRASADVLPANGRGSSTVALIGFGYYGLVLGVRLVRMAMSADGRSGGSRLLYWPLLLAYVPAMLAVVPWLMLSLSPSATTSVAAPSDKVTPEYNKAVVLTAGMEVLPLTDQSHEIEKRRRIPAAPHCAEARQLAPRLDEQCRYFGELQGWGQPENAKRSGDAYDVRLLDGAISDYGARRLLVLVFATVLKECNSSYACNTALSAVVAEQDAQGLWRGVMRHQYFALLEVDLERVQLRAGPGALMEVVRPNRLQDQQAISVNMDLYQLGPQGVQRLNEDRFYTQCRYANCANSAGACAWEGRLELKPGWTPDQPREFLWKQEGIDPHGAFNAQGVLEYSKRPAEASEWRNCWAGGSQPLHPAEAPPAEACSIARAVDPRLDASCNYLGPLPAEELPANHLAGDFGHARQLRFAHPIGDAAGGMQALIFATRALTRGTSSCSNCGLNLDAVIVAREGDGWRLVRRLSNFAHIKETLTAPLVSARALADGNLLIDLRQTVYQYPTRFENLLLYRLTPEGAQALLAEPFLTRCEESDGNWSWTGSVEVLGGNGSAELEFEQHGEFRDRRESPNTQFSNRSRFALADGGPYKSGDWRSCHIRTGSY